LKLWDFALVAYARDDVREACLKLQDRDGQSVCLLLWAGWAASESRPLPPETLASALAAARQWEHGVTGPLRAARRMLRSHGHAALAGTVGAAEIEAERLLLVQLEGLTPPPKASAVNQLSVLVAVTSAWAPLPAPDRLDALAQALASACRPPEL
jgi:uncharacterized protein (TIGR02444 family)